MGKYLERPRVSMPLERQVRAHLAECGRKFLSMMDVHLCEYEGKAFYIKKGQVVEIQKPSRGRRALFSRREPELLQTEHQGIQ
jgi:hypothetical protein